MFIFNTDHLGIVRRDSAPEHAALLHRMRQHSLEDFFVTIVSFHEQANGWNQNVARQPSPVDAHVDHIVHGRGAGGDRQYQKMGS